jgi:hypothetical protein
LFFATFFAILFISTIVIFSGARYTEWSPPCACVSFSFEHFSQINVHLV